MSRVVGVFGGSFNPPHFGHVFVAEYVRRSGLVDDVIIEPVFKHAFNKQLAPFEDRVAMCRRAFQHCIVRTDEEDSNTGFTSDLLKIMHEKMPNTKFRIILSDETYNQRDKWEGWDELMTLTSPIIVMRGDSKVEGDNISVLPIQFPELSSTVCRERLEAGLSLQGYVPNSVESYIKTNSLYRKI